MRRIWMGALTAVLCLILLACSAQEKTPAANAAPEESSVQTQTMPEATEKPTAEPTEKPTAEPTEEPTPAPTEEPDYWKYVLLRDEWKQSFSSTQEAWDRMMELYNLEKELNAYTCGLFLVNWDTLEYDYAYRLNGLISEFLMMAKEEAYQEENNAPILHVFYEPENAEVVAPGVLKVEQNQWLRELKDYPPVYFISLESEDPAQGCWISVYQDVPESVLHPASVTEESMAELKQAVNAKKIADSGMVLSEGELVIDGVDYKALRNHVIEKYLTTSSMHSEFFNVLYELQKNPFDKTPNAAFFLDWSNPNGFRWTGWYMNELDNAYQKLKKSLKSAPTAEQLMPLTFYPDKLEKLDDYIYRSTENDWLKKAGGSIIWIGFNSDDPATGYWIGFYGPVPDVVWE